MLNETTVPQANYRWTLIKEKFLRASDGQQGYSKQNIAVKVDQNAYFIKSYDIENQEMHQVTILKYDLGDNILQRVDAQKAKWTGRGWMFYEGFIRDFSQSEERQSILTPFAQRFFSLSSTPETFEKSLSIKMMNYQELKQHIATMKDSGYETLKEEVMLHSRISFPFASFVILIVGIPFLLMTSQQRGGMMAGVILSVLISFVYRSTMILGMAMGNGGHLPPALAAWFGNILFLLLGVYF